MPIQFRCTTCNQLLSISRKKAGVEILCPKCTTLTRVPQIAEAEDAGDSPLEPQVKAVPRPAPPIIERKPAPVEQRRVDPPIEQEAPEFEAPAPPVLTPPASDQPPGSPPMLQPRMDPAPERAVVTAAASAAYNPWTDIDHDEDDFHPTRRQHPPKDELDMTSLVDVTFLLLVFFMITASFTVQKFLQIAAPESDDSAAAATAVVSNDDIVGESVVVTVDAEDRIQVDDMPVAGLAELKELFGRKLRDEQKTDVLIEAAYQATHGTVVAVTDMAIQAEMRHVRRASRRDADE